MYYDCYLVQYAFTHSLSAIRMLICEVQRFSYVGSPPKPGPECVGFGLAVVFGLVFPSALSVQQPGLLLVLTFVRYSAHCSVCQFL